MAERPAHSPSGAPDQPASSGSSAAEDDGSVTAIVPVQQVSDSLAFSQLLERLAEQRWSPDLPFTETNHLSVPRQLLTLRDLPVRRDLHRLHELLLDPEMCGGNGKELRRRWFHCFHLFVSFNAVASFLDRSFLLPFLALKLVSDPSSTTERMTRWLDKREELTAEVISAQALFDLEGKSSWAVKSAYSNMKSSFLALRELLLTHMKYSEKTVLPVRDLHASSLCALPACHPAFSTLYAGLTRCAVDCDAAAIGGQPAV